MPHQEAHSGETGGFTAGARPTLSPKKPSGLRRTFWFLVFLVIAVVVLGGFWGFEQFKQKMTAQYFATMVTPPTPVSTIKAGAEAVPQSLEAIGTLTAAHQVTVSPQVDGKIVALKFESGQTVNAGDVLVQLDDASERADLATYQAQARLATANLARARQLAAKQFGSKQDVDLQQSQLDQANAGIAKSQTEIGYKTIKAPFGGQLGIRQVNLGQYLAAGAAIVTLTDLDQLYVDFTLPEQDRTSLSVGQAVELRLDAFPDRVFQASIMTIDPQVDPNMRAVKVRGKLDNADHALQPGMFARVAVILPPQPDVVTLPETAVDYTVYGDSVYLVKEGKDKDGKPLTDKDGKPQLVAEQTFVTIGPRFGDKVAIAKGVTPGDTVVVGGQLKLHNGATVTLSTDTSLENPTTLPKE
ncbi:MAG TPA: efflux RND transporter periplasmic adaptor subunit [Dongiaceae bacterium]|nr:efflux RND transporter periplasmic adaptor subunit [Dongiaceae bacterium]